MSDRSVARSTTEPGVAPARGAERRSGRMPPAGAFARWEVFLFAILLVLIWEGTQLSDVFLTGANFSNLASSVGEVAIMALPSTLIIITGEIDLSVESTLGLASAILGFLWAAGVPLQIGIPLVLVVGVLCGLLNGLLVARAGLPSLVVTLGTLALYRGLASVTLGPTAVSDFPAWFTSFGFGNVPNTSIPWTLLVFAVLAVVFGLVLHAMWPGRQVYAVGKNKDAARFSGVHVQTMKLALFVVSGIVSALAGVLLTARFSSARADNGTGLVLLVVTIVLLGGVDINGGKGTLVGVVIAVFTLAVLQSELRLAGVSSEYQAVAVGCLLIVSVTAPTIARQARSALHRVRGGAHPPPGSTVPPGEVVVQ
jgi:rhamnose transport system permease protein